VTPFDLIIGSAVHPQQKVPLVWCFYKLAELPPTLLAFVQFFCHSVLLGGRVNYGNQAYSKHSFPWEINHQMEFREAHPSMAEVMILEVTAMVPCHLECIQDTVVLDIQVHPLQEMPPMAYVVV
jgi:hypothetical protein